MIEKQTRTMQARFSAALLFSVAAAGSLASSAVSVHAQVRAQQPAYPAPGGTFRPPTTTLQLPTVPAPTAITANAAVVEDVVARVNDQIVTRTEYERSQQQLLQESQQGNATQADLNSRERDLLRDMIDQQLLLSKGKELGISGDAETIRRLDEIRKQNHLDSMEALEKAVSQQGLSYEDFKQSIRNSVITQTVVREEVGRRINLSRTQEEAYYAEHAKEFEQPEQVHLSEILIPTPENATDAQVTTAQAKADDVAAKLKAGGKFTELAKTTSGGPTASGGGDLGDFKRGTLGQVLEDATFALPVGGVTAPIRTRQGFVILRVDAHQKAGVPLLTEVEPQVQEGIYVAALQPALRVYLTKARNEAYVLIKDGFVDTGSNRKESKPVFTAYAPPPVKKKVLVKQRLEQEKAAKAQADLAAARAKVAEKQAAKAAADAAKNGGVVNTSKPAKAPKIHREKVRYGQAPRNALPAAPLASLGDSTEPQNAPLAGQAPGVAMASMATTSTISTGTGIDSDADPLTPRAPQERKTRYASRQQETEEARAKEKFVKAEVKATKRPVAATAQESATEKQQAAPLGLNGDTKNPKKKAKKGKDDPKERLQEKVKPVETPAVVAPTVNPVLSSPTTTTAPATPSSDRTTLPPATSGAPNALPQGQPVPATAPGTTPASPGSSTPR